MFKRYCDVCAEEVPLRPLAKANEPGKQEYKDTIKCGGVKVRVDALVEVASKNSCTDICDKCAKKAIRVLINRKPKKNNGGQF